MIGLLLCGIWFLVVLAHAWRVARDPFYFEARPLRTWLKLGRPMRKHEAAWWYLKWWLCFRWLTSEEIEEMYG